MMYKKNQEHCERKILLVAISAAVLVGSFVVGSQFVKSSMAQDLGQMGQQAKEKIGGAAKLKILGNQTGNQTGNQSGGVLGQLGEQAKSMLPGQ
ncbi:MAG: hypothetical protein WBL67_08170 [Nitrososphaeraceae archaeon]